MSQTNDHEELPEGCAVDRPSHGLFESSTAPGVATGDKAVAGPGSRANIYDRSNLTRNQLQVWIGQKLLPEVPVYHLATALNIRGEMDPLHFQKAFQTLVNSSDALRTVIEEVDGTPIQKVLPDFPYSMDCLDFSLRPNSQEAAKAWMRERCQVPFDLQQRLFDSALIKVSDEEYVWYLNLHHFIGDGWSFELIYRLMADLYRRSVEGRLTETIPLPGFQRYVAHEREYRNSSRYQRAEAYWKKQLAESSDPISFYGKAPVKQTTKTQRLVCDLGPERTKKLKALIVRERQAGGTEEAAMFNIFCALLATYLYHLTGNASYSIGIPFHNRRSKPFKETIGFFSEVLPLQFAIAENETFSSLVRKIKAKHFETIRHGPFALPNPHYKKAYDVVLNYHTGFLTHFDGKPAAAEWIHTAHGDDSLALQIHDFASSGALTLNFDFHCEIFTPEQSRQSVNHFLRVLDAFLGDSPQPLQQISLIPPDEKQRILEEWNNTAADYPRDRCIHHLFEEQVKRTPEAVGVVFENERLQYRELNRRANQLAHRLQDLGVGPEVPVGVYMERSVEMVVGILGILKAGGSYVPLDPDYPEERLGFMLEDSGASVLVTQSRLVSRLPMEERAKTEDRRPAQSAIRNSQCAISHPSSVPGLSSSFAPCAMRPSTVVCLDADWESIARENDEDPVSGVTAENLAYVIYTSGSTGRPKGVEVTHKALVNFTTSARHAFALEESDRLLQFASISFDTAAEEIFPCLLSGATLVLRSDSMLGSVSAFLERCREWGVTVLDLPTVYWHELTEKLSSERLALPERLRLVIVGGEKALPDQLAQWRQSVDGHVRLLNTYGPTEATVVATTWELTEAEGADVPLQEVPIGRPIPNVQVYILDKRLQPVAVGVPGELHIGGEGLARGYRNRPELTLERFISHPFGKEPGARLYKTGDLARYLPDGNIEYLRRIDHQVKIRGFRVEPGEIEAVLSQHAAVQQAVVMAREDIGSTDRELRIANSEGANPQSAIRNSPSPVKRLVAYVVPKQELSVSDLRSYLKQKLPDYMVPSVFVQLKTLPLTPNGKIDSRALPAPDQSRSEAGASFIAPRTPIEETLAGMWRELLELEEVGVYDNFFELGGHSLLATQVISRVHDLFKIDLSLRALFQTPTIAKIAERIQAELSNGHRAVAAAPITAVSRERELPLSCSQGRMWFLHQLAPESRAYNMAAPLRFTGRLNKAALERGLNELVKRHESLRTTFPCVNGSPVQVIAPARAVKITEMDLRLLPEDQRLEEAKRIVGEDARRPFDLEQGPLMRPLLVQLGEDDHVLQLTMHHIISDQWSFSIIARELASLYNAFCDAPSVPIPPLAVQYADFAVWQNQRLGGENLETQLSYWKKQLTGLQVLDMPTDYPRPSVQTFHGAHVTMDLPVSLIEGLKRLSVQEGVTLYMALLAAFKTLLYKYSGQQDIAIGSPIANRNLLATEGIVGTFVNILVMRTDLSGDPTFRELLARVREVALGAYAHQELPFEKLVEELQPERDMSHSPLVQVLFNLHNAPIREVDLLGLSWSPFEIDIEASQFDIGVSIDTEITKKIMLAYNTDLYSNTTIKQMLRHYLSLLEEVVARPEVRIAQLQLLSAEEQRKILSEWNDTDSEYPRRACLPEPFEAQVERNPEAIAASMEGESLNYYELNARANQLARSLCSLGVGPEVRVAICMHRSLDMLVCLLGVLKAGGAYVPIDPDYPSERISFMLEDSETAVLVTQEGLAETLPDCGARVVCVDQVFKKMARRSRRNLSRRAGPENLAYLIYTSGSTGKPKGVEIPHKALVNFLESMLRKPGLTDQDILLSVTTLSFDIAGLELYLPLIVGGRVELVSRETAADGIRLIERLASTGATVMQATPATWRLLLQSGWKGTRGLKILCGGEELSRDLAKALVERGDSVWNLYGPTETTIWSTVWKVELGKGTLAIGRPIANTQIYILDANLQPVPVGIQGELYIGGDGLARGYLKRPELTREKFIHNPFSQEEGSRLYRTGDLARYLSDGNIEYLGRVDHQVKLRGFRVELGEIEAILVQHPSVRETAVLAREDVPGDTRLVAYYIVAEQQPAPAIRELRGFLKQKIPDYMVPSAFVLLDALPLTPNGKLNRGALPAPDRARAEREQDYVPPRTPVEEILAGIWVEVLRLARVGVNDNFFELGGHSLLATQVISRLRNSLGVDIPLRFLFEAPTVAGLAERVEAAYRTAQGSPVPPMQRASRERNLPLSFAQQRLWFLNQLEPGSPVYNLPGAVRLSGALDIIALERSLTEIVRRHETLRTTFRSVDGEQPVQIISPAEPFTLSVSDLAELPEVDKETKVRQIVNEEAKQPFDLARGPLIRARLLRLGEQEYVLVFVIHHIATDGWSHGVLFRELATLYEAFSAANMSPLPELPIQYADFAVWQREWLQGEVLENQLSYWKKQLDGAPPVLELPTDRPRPPVRSLRGARQSLQLSSTLTEGLKGLSRREGVTVFMTLLAAFQTLLHRYTGQEDIVVGSPIANRTRAEIEGLIGFFANTLALRTDLSGNPSFLEILGRVREVALGAYAHQDLPFEKLVEEFQPERHLSHSPLFQVMFVFQNAPSVALEVPGLALNPMEVHCDTAKLDLTLSMLEGSEGLSGVVEYNSDLFDEATIRRMLGHFQTLLEGIVADPSKKILALPLLTEGEYHQQLVEWNDTGTDCPADSCIHQIFDTQANRTPNATAVVFEDKELTYWELNARANQLAHHLKRMGVGPEVRVGICMERSLEMIIGLLGILKAGGAYVPLDPAYPRERLRFMLEDNQVPVLLTQQKLLNSVRLLPAGHQSSLHGMPRPVCLDADWGLIAQERDETPVSETTTQNLAYVMYTSGSTGRPKGVEITHANVWHYLRSISTALEIHAQDVYLHSASFSFSSSVRQLWMPLSQGAQAVISTDEQSKNPLNLLDLIQQRRVTVCDTVQSVWLHGLEALESWDEASIETLLTWKPRLIVFSGGLLTCEFLNTLRRKLGDHLQIINIYGQTESIGACTYTVPNHFDKKVGFVPVGRPLARTQVYILDSHLLPLSIGVPGELFVTSESLARGYLNHQDLTSEKFIPNPFSERSGARLYRTGDLARYLSDGTIEILGRMDNQVKIRGFRIELREIEVVLGQHPAVRETAVLAREDETGDRSTPLKTGPSTLLRTGKQLVAYVVLCQEPAPTIDEFRKYLKEKLPDYMVPSAFVFLDLLPRTPNGKVDRKALPPPRQGRNRLEETYVASRTPVEAVLARIWSDSLGIEQPGIYDNFFELGGHSLLVIQVHSRVRNMFHVDLPLRTLFEKPTIQECSKVIIESLAERLGGNRMNRLLSEVEKLSDKEVQKQLANELSRFTDMKIDGQHVV